MIRFAQNIPQDTLQARKIWAECFGDPPVWLEWYFQEVYEPENTLFYEVDGHLASHLQMRYFDLSLRGRTVRAGYLAGVATYPQYRKQGFSRALIEKAFAHLRAGGAEICFLVPTIFRFYERLGFATCYDKTLYQITHHELPLPADEPWQQAGTDSGLVLDAAYRYALRGDNGYVLRSEKDWRTFLQDNIDNGGAECRFWQNGEACGYFLARRNAEENKMFVIEYGYTSPDIRTKVLRQIARTAQSVRKLELLVPPDDRLYTNFCDCRTARSVQPYAMARVLSAEYALSLCAKDFCGSVRIAVADPLIAENNGVFTVENHAVSCGGTADIQLDIQTLAMLVWGYVDWNVAYDMRLIHGDVRKAEGLFQVQKNYLDNAVLAF